VFLWVALFFASVVLYADHDPHAFNYAIAALISGRSSRS
jgi:hypothetical protein